jgi:hypothetical protein
LHRRKNPIFDLPNTKTKMKKFLAILSLAAFMSSSMASPLVSSFNNETVSVSKLDKDKDKDKDKKKKKKEKACSEADASKSGSTTAPKSCCSKDASKSCSKDQKQVAPAK